MATPLYPTFEKRVSDAVNAIIAAQVTPWSFLTAGPPFRVKHYDGREINYQGGTFDGSPNQVFWGRYIEPFLEEMIVRELADVVKACNEHKVDAGEALPELQGLLFSGCSKVFARMADVDRRLRGKGYPDSVQLRPVQDELDQMAAFIQSRVTAHLDLWKRRRWERWYEQNKFGDRLLGVLLVIAGLVLTAWLALRQKPQEKPPEPSPSTQQAPALENKVEAPTTSNRAAVDSLQVVINEFKRYDLEEAGVDVAVEKEDDPKYMAIWRRKMRMLDSIEDIAKKLHREPEVQAYLALRSTISVESKAGPLIGKPIKRTRATQ